LCVILRSIVKCEGDGVRGSVVVEYLTYQKSVVFQRHLYLGKLNAARLTVQQISNLRPRNVERTCTWGCSAMFSMLASILSGLSNGIPYYFLSYIVLYLSWQLG